MVPRSLAAPVLSAAIAVLGMARPAIAFHSDEFFAADAAEVLPPGGNEVLFYGAFFRPEIYPTTGQHIQLTPAYRRGISKDFQFEYHFHWVTDPAKGLHPGESLFQEHGLAVKQVFPPLGTFPLRLAASGEVELPTAHAMQKVGAATTGKLRFSLSRRLSGGILFGISLDGLAEVGLRCDEATVRTGGAPRRHTAADAQACRVGEPTNNLDWGFAVGIRKTLSGHTSASVELAKEIDYPPGVTTLVGFHLHPERTWFLHFAVGFPTGLDEDFSIRLGGGTKF